MRIGTAAITAKCPSRESNHAVPSEVPREPFLPGVHGREEQKPVFLAAVKESETNFPEVRQILLQEDCHLTTLLRVMWRAKVILGEMNACGIECATVHCSCSARECVCVRGM